MNEYCQHNKYCQSVCWMEEYGRDAECSLPPGHEGMHWDQVEGLEW